MRIARSTPILFLVLAACSYEPVPSGTSTPAATPAAAPAAAPVASGEQQRLDRTHAFVVSTLGAVNRDPMASMSWQSLAEMGGSPADYLAASMPENADFTDIAWQEPPAAWTVVIDAEGASAFRVHSYGADTATALRSDTVTLTPVPIR